MIMAFDGSKKSGDVSQQDVMRLMIQKEKSAGRRGFFPCAGSASFRNQFPGKQSFPLKR